MVQYIPGPEALLAPAAAQITEGVLNFLNPNRQFQQAVQAAMSKDPSVAQGFADLEASSPGLLKSLGIGRLASIPATPEKQFEIGSREALLGGMDAKLGAETAKNRFSMDQINRAMQLMQQDPGIGMDAALKSLTGETFSERAVSQVAGQKAGAASRMLQDPSVNATAGYIGATGMTPGKAAEDSLMSRAITHAQKMLADGPEVTMQNFLEGKFSNEDRLAVFSTPLGDSIKQQMDWYNDQLRISLMAGRQDDAMERLIRGQAFNLYSALNDPGVSVNDVLSYITRPRGQAPAAGDTTATRIEQGLARLQAGDVNEVVSRNRKDLVALYARYQASASGKETKGKGGDESRELLVSEMDKILDTNSKLPGGQRYTVTYEDVVRNKITGNIRQAESVLVPDRKTKEIVFRDAQGNIVTPGQALGAGSSSVPNNEQQQNNKITLDPAQVRRAKSYFDGLSKEAQAAQKARWQTELSPESFKALFP